MGEVWEVAPRVQEPLEALDRRVIGLWRLRLAVGTVLSAVAAGVLVRGWAGTLPAGLLMAAAVGGIGTALAVVLPVARYRAWGYRIRERDLLLRHGVLWKRSSVVPHARIQHVDMRAGPIERWLGLSRVVVFTAGSTGGAVAIPGLAEERAERLRDRLADLGGGDDAV